MRARLWLLCFISVAHEDYNSEARGLQMWTIANS